MKKSDRLYKKIINDISNKVFGGSGSRFVTTRELSKKYNVSLVTAHKIKQMLIDNNYVRQIGRKGFLTTGAFDTGSDVQKIYTKTKTIGFHFSKINNQYFSDIAMCASEYASSLGYNLVIMVSNGKEDFEKMALNQFFNMRVVGVISYEGVYGDKDNNLYSNYPLPVVFLGSDASSGKSDISAVDNGFLAKSVANHLIEQGYKRFMYVTNSKSAISAVRQKGFTDELKRRGFDIENPNDVYFDENIQNAVYPHIRKAISYGEPVGIFCYHDIVASNVKASCDKHDILCPEQVGIVGFDNLSDLPFDDISTIEYSRNSVVKQAIDILVSRQNKLEVGSQYIPGYLIIRKSSSLRKR